MHFLFTSSSYGLKSNIFNGKKKTNLVCHFCTCRTSECLQLHCKHLLGMAALTWNRGSAIGGRGAKASLKISKKGKIRKYGVYFNASKLIKLDFLSSLLRKYMFWKSFYHNFSTKKASASGDLVPWPHQGALPLDPQVPSTPLTIYPGATPD